MIRRTAAAILVAGVMIVGAACSADDETADDASVTTVAATGEADDATEAGTADCAELAEAAAPARASASFPDNADATWTVEGVEIDADGRALVEVVPSTDDVGYPRFRMLHACDGDDVVLLGTYALDDDGWVLLFTTDQPGAADLEPTLAD